MEHVEAARTRSPGCGQDGKQLKEALQQRNEEIQEALQVRWLAISGVWLQFSLPSRGIAKWHKHVY